MRMTLLTFAVAALVASGPVFAQQSQPAPATNTPREGSINDRRPDQQQRIANGVQSGQLTTGETKNLESREANINREIHADRSADGGKLTTQERHHIQHQENNVSRSIYTDKHNAAQARFGKGEIDQRRENQQDRIANGIRSGAMSPAEAARSEGHEQQINRQIASDHHADGGRLSAQQQRQINRRQNGASRQIYRQNHNHRRAPK